MQGLVIEWVTIKAFHEDFTAENGKVHSVTCIILSCSDVTNNDIQTCCWDTAEMSSLYFRNRTLERIVIISESQRRASMLSVVSESVGSASTDRRWVMPIDQPVTRQQQLMLPGVGVPQIPRLLCLITNWRFRTMHKAEHYLSWWLKPNYSPLGERAAS